MDKVFEGVKRALGQKWEGVELEGTVCEKRSTLSPILCDVTIKLSNADLHVKIMVISTSFSLCSWPTKKKVMCSVFPSPILLSIIQTT